MGEFSYSSNQERYTASVIIPAIQKHTENIIQGLLGSEKERTVYCLGCGDTSFYAQNAPTTYVEPDNEALGRTKKVLEELGYDISKSEFLSKHALDVIPDNNSVAVLIWSLHHMGSEDNKKIDEELLEEHVDYLKEKLTELKEEMPDEKGPIKYGESLISRWTALV